MKVQCFLLKETNRVQLFLRRFVYSDKLKCPIHGYHDARILWKEIIQEPNSYLNGFGDEKIKELKDHPGWPKKCNCGYEFKEGDEWQIFNERLWERQDTHELISLRDAPPGAMWDAWWYHDVYKGPDGKCLVVKMPGNSEWIIDSRASNCTMPNDNEHHCWIRHGEPPFITVDKNGKTCNAGAGSIAVPGWHGFLTRGILSESRNP